MSAERTTSRADEPRDTSARRAAAIALPAGAVASVALLFTATRRNPSRLLIALLMLWVLTPYVALAGGSVFSRRWAAASRATIDWLIITVALGSCTVYAYAVFGPPLQKGGFPFIALPPALCLLIAIVTAIAARASRRNNS
jgi:cation transport ATPase